MATKASRVGYLGRQRRMSIFRVSIDVAGQAKATTVAHRVKFMRGLFLTQVTARTELAQHGIGRAMTQRLQVGTCFVTDTSVDNFPRHANHAATCVHQAVAYRQNLVGVASAAGALRIVQQPGKPGHPGMRVPLCGGRAVAAVADDAIVGAE